MLSNMYANFSLFVLISSNNHDPFIIYLFVIDGYSGAKVRKKRNIKHVLATFFNIIIFVCRCMKPAS